MRGKITLGHDNYTKVVTSLMECTLVNIFFARSEASDSGISFTCVVDVEQLSYTISH
jgi:hypothetical protein